MRVYPLETHLAEKLHAYTLPRNRPNSRVKDLPDMALLAGVREIDGARLLAAFEQTFRSRRIQGLPTVLPAPPAAWSAPYAHMADQDKLPWPDIATLVAAVEAFINPVLAGTNAVWRPDAWSWVPPAFAARP